MAMTVTVTPDSTAAWVRLDVSGHQHSTSTVTIQRRVPPTSRELASIAFVPFDERHREVVIVDGGRLGATFIYWDFHARATVPYEYQAREVFASGAIQDWSPWTA